MKAMLCDIFQNAAPYECQAEIEKISKQDDMIVVYSLIASAPTGYARYLLLQILSLERRLSLIHI